MTDIPEDIRKTATQCFADVDFVDTVPEAIDIIIKALMAERERCAKMDITPKMIEAGVEQIMFYDQELDSGRELVVEVFRAMITARNQG